MIKSGALLTLVALLPWQPQAGPTIEIRFGNGDKVAVFTIDPGGMMTLDRPGDANGEGRVSGKHFAGFPSYMRIAALVKPVRRWIGGEVPCDSDGRAFAEGGYWQRPVTRIRWQPGAAEVSVPIDCMHGPAMDEIELTRAAIDELKRWANDLEARSNGAANVIEYSENVHEGD